MAVFSQRPQEPPCKHNGAAISCDSDEARALLWAADCGSQQGGLPPKWWGRKLNVKQLTQLVLIQCKELRQL